ncbi:MAG: hypothetical protein WC292_00090 [Clostridia bacterium]
MSGTITPNGSIESDYADNKTHEQLVNYAAADISLEVTGLGPAGYEFVTGRVVSDAGGTVMMAGQASPELAVAFEVLNAQRKRVRYIIYNAIFPEGENALQTKGDGVEFGHLPLEGRITDLLYEGELTRLSDNTVINADGIRFMTMTEDGVDFDKTKWDNWFQNVQLPTGDAFIPAADFDAFSFEAGSGAGETDITIAGTGIDEFVYVIGERSRPTVGTPISGGTTTQDGGTISGVSAGTYISVYGLDTNDKAVAFGVHKLLAAEVG